MIFATVALLPLSLSLSVDSVDSVEVCHIPHATYLKALAHVAGVVRGDSRPPPTKTLTPEKVRRASAN
jgi:hypothetical protein